MTIPEFPNAGQDFNQMIQIGYVEEALDIVASGNTPSPTLREAMHKVYRGYIDKYAAIDPESPVTVNLSNQAEFMRIGKIASFCDQFPRHDSPAVLPEPIRSGLTHSEQQAISFFGTIEPATNRYRLSTIA